MTGIIDYGLGNLFSLEKALKRNHSPYLISSLPAELQTCDRFILAGVGHFEFGVQQLHEKNLFAFIQQQVNDGKFLLGICLGMQLVCSASEEGHVAGLNLVPVNVERLKVQPPAKIPHIGWNSVYDSASNPLFNGIGETEKFYFTHSYGVLNASGYGAGTTDYGNVAFYSAIRKENVFGVQFHPEKSFDQGLTVLKNFCGL
ncbi:MAG: imidazole glycerol phosphate synthase subunit HisH [Bacteroidetes bacterium]|nr:imidazole glycerol phosphate synthase subunit HisH [Bacteroidota bacterium]